MQTGSSMPARSDEEGVRQPIVSVVTLTRNRREQLSTLLQSLRCQDFSARETIVVDNASTDGTLDMLRTRFPEVRIVESVINAGTYSYTLGITQAKGKYIILIDDDGLPARCDWISELVARFEHNSRLGAAACLIRMADTGRIADDSPQFIPEGSAMAGFPTCAYNGTGAALRASAIAGLLPIYPQQYFRSWIELHLCTRLLSAGWDVRLFPTIEVWHCRPSGSSTPPLSYYGLRNYLWYVATFYPWPDWLTEAMHFVASRAKQVAQGKVAPSLIGRSLVDSAAGMRRVLRGRQPLSHGTMEYMRAVRREANWSECVPMEIPTLERPT